MSEGNSQKKKKIEKEKDVEEEKKADRQQVTDKQGRKHRQTDTPLARKHGRIHESQRQAMRSYLNLTDGRTDRQRDRVSTRGALVSEQKDVIHGIKREKSHESREKEKRCESWKRKRKSNEETV